MTVAEPTTDGTYRDRIVAVEPGGNEFIAEADRHGKPVQLFWTWTSPNLEFATIFVGMLAVLAFGMTFWQAVAGIAIGTGLGAVAHYFLSARGPLHGVPQMVIGADGLRVQGQRGARGVDVDDRRRRVVRHQQCQWRVRAVDPVRFRPADRA